MKIRNFFLLSVLSSVIMLQACSEDDDNGPSKPEIDNFIVESEGGGDQITRGGQISYEADIASTSDAKLDYFHVEIHDEPESGKAEDEYKIIDKDFTDNIRDLRNTHLHEHITVPDTANTGTYHFHLTVVDKDGNTNNAETHIEVFE